MILIIKASIYEYTKLGANKMSKNIWFFIQLFNSLNPFNANHFKIFLLLYQLIKIIIFYFDFTDNKSRIITVIDELINNMINALYDRKILLEFFKDL
jgi:hypothetical protein